MGLPTGAPRSLKRLWAYLEKHVANIEGGGGEAAPVAWADVTGKPATFPPVIGSTATTAMAGNTALLAIGTTASTAAAGNHTHAATAVTVAAGTAGLAAGNVQTQLQALATRIAALEAAAG
ncbi:hypothetical protein GCM10009434_03210 [Brevundimonas olei]